MKELTNKKVIGFGIGIGLGFLIASYLGGDEVEWKRSIFITVSVIISLLIYKKIKDKPKSKVN